MGLILKRLVASQKFEKQYLKDVPNSIYLNLILFYIKSFAGTLLLTFF